MKVLFSFFIALAISPTICFAQALPEVTIAEYGEFLLYATLYVADADGLFEKQGIKVKIVPAGGDEKVFAALIAGSAQFGIGDPTFVAISGEKGLPGKVIYSILQNAPAWGVAIKPEIKPITKPEELKPYTVATYPAPSTSYSLQKKIFQLGKLEPKIAPITYGGLISALLANRVDIALEYEPNVSLAVEKGAHLVYSVSTYFPELALTGLTVLPDYLEKNPEIAQKVVNALQLASVKLFKDTDAVALILGKRFPEYSQSVIKSGLVNSLKTSTFPQDGIITEEGWRQSVLLRKELGDLKMEAPYQKYVVTSFAEKAKLLK